MARSEPLHGKFRELFWETWKALGVHTQTGEATMAKVLSESTQQSETG